MKRKPTIPHPDPEFVIWGQNLSDNIDAYVAPLGLVQADVDAVKAAFGVFKTAYQAAVDAKANAMTAVHGAQNRRTETESLIRPLIKDIKNKPAYNNEIGADLGLIGAEIVVDPNTVKPEVSKITVLPDQVILDWSRGHMQGVVIYGAKRTQRNTNPETLTATNDVAGLIAGWDKLDKDYKSPYEDKRPNIGPDPEVRLYMARYIDNDEPVGLESEIFKVLVDIQPDNLI